jgi:hypothetical protein
MVTNTFHFMLLLEGLGQHVNIQYHLSKLEINSIYTVDELVNFDGINNDTLRSWNTPKVFFF